MNIKNYFKAIIASMLIGTIPGVASSQQNLSCTPNRDIYYCAKDNCNYYEAQMQNPDNINTNEKDEVLRCTAKCLYRNNKIDTLKPNINYCVFAYGKTGSELYYASSINWIGLIDAVAFDDKENETKFYFGLFVTDDTDIKPGTKIDRNHSYKLSAKSLDQCTYTNKVKRNYEELSPASKNDKFPGLLYHEKKEETYVSTTTRKSYVIDAKMASNLKSKGYIKGYGLTKISEEFQNYKNKTPDCPAAIYLVMTNVGNYKSEYVNVENGRTTSNNPGNLDTFPSELTVLDRVH